jgi:fumarylacetoacetase
MTTLDPTHDPELRSWVASANRPGCDFPIQNLPFGRFRRAGCAEAWRIGVAIGDQVLDLKAVGLIDTGDMNLLMAAQPTERRSLRTALSEGLREGSREQARWVGALLPQISAEYTVPCRIADYTDFYTGIHHATAVGRLFRPDQPLMPNYKWVPIGYHGRASSIVVSGHPVKRPRGQTRKPDAAAPEFGPSRWLDYELELGYFVGRGNALGNPVPIHDAEDHLFGVCLLNDWSARDVQAWEYQPLGPFLAKSFATTVSPWIVTMEALAPFRTRIEQPVEDPQPLPYLDSTANRERGAIDVVLEVWLQTARMAATQEGPVRLSSTRAAQAVYWTAAQLVAHHTSNGCNLQAGDLLGSGTLSGPAPEQAGSLLELSSGGRQPITLPNGETRTFLEDGDRLVMHSWCEREGAVRIGFGEAAGTILGQ